LKEEGLCFLGGKVGDLDVSERFWYGGGRLEDELGGLLSMKSSRIWCVGVEVKNTRNENQNAGYSSEDIEWSSDFGGEFSDGSQSQND
jgi:hypothetical protein